MVAVGTAVGLLTGFFGIGGGFVIVPTLVLALGFTMPEAVGTSLLVITIDTVVALGSRPKPARSIGARSSRSHSPASSASSSARLATTKDSAIVPGPGHRRDGVLDVARPGTMRCVVTRPCNLGVPHGTGHGQAEGGGVLLARRRLDHVSAGATSASLPSTAKPAHPIALPLQGEAPHHDCVPPELTVVAFDRAPLISAVDHDVGTGDACDTRSRTLRSEPRPPRPERPTR